MNSATSSEPDHGIQLWLKYYFIISLMGGVVLISSFIAMCIICCKKKKIRTGETSGNLAKLRRIDSWLWLIFPIFCWSLVLFSDHMLRAMEHQATWSRFISGTAVFYV